MHRLNNVTKRMHPMVIQKPLDEDNGDSPVVYKSTLAVLEKVHILLPRDIIDVCNALQEKFVGNEFSFLVKGGWTSDGFRIGSEYVIPKQRVAFASVEYDREDLLRLKQSGYNTVIHSHPCTSVYKGAKAKTSTTAFSIDDENTINNHFACSILYHGGSIADARLTMTVSEGVKLKLDVDDVFTVYNANVTLPEDVESTIEVEPEKLVYRTHNVWGFPCGLGGTCGDDEESYDVLEEKIRAAYGDHMNRMALLRE